MDLTADEQVYSIAMVHVTMLLELDVLMMSARRMPFRIENLNHFISAEKYRRPGQLSNGTDGFASCIAACEIFVSAAKFELPFVALILCRAGSPLGRFHWRNYPYKISSLRLLALKYLGFFSGTEFAVKLKQAFALDLNCLVLRCAVS